MTSPFAFFALVAGPRAATEPGAPKAPCETRRLLVSNDVQQALSREFERQAAELTHPDRTRVPYDPGYKLAAGEVFFVDASLAPQDTGPHALALPTSLAAAVRAPNVAEIVDAAVLRDGRLRSLCAARGSEGEVALVFQLFQQSQVIRQGNWRYLHFLDDTRTFTSLDSECLALANSAAAVYQASRLFFASEATVRRFLDLGSLFHAATDRELAHFFAGSGLWAPVDLPALLGQADEQMRHAVAKIAFLENLAGVTPRAIQLVAQAHGIDVKRTAGRLVVPQEKRELKSLIRILADDLLESPLTHWSYWSNSKRRITTPPARPQRAKVRARARQPRPSPAVATHVH